jgi:hypothetical protein
VENRLNSLRVRLDGKWPTHRVRSSWGASSQWLPGIDLEPLRAALANRVRVEALAKGCQIIAAERIVSLTNEARLARAVEIARARQAAYLPRGQGPYAIRKRREQEAAATADEIRHRKNGRGT